MIESRAMNRAEAIETYHQWLAENPCAPVGVVEITTGSGEVYRFATSGYEVSESEFKRLDQRSLLEGGSDGNGTRESR
jgi:hypothetical protein